LLYELKKAAGELPAHLPHFERSKMIAERKAILDRAQRKAALDREQSRPMAVEHPAPASPPTPIRPHPEPQNQRIRYLLFTNPPVAIAKLYRHFRGPPRAPVERAATPTAAPATPKPVSEPSSSAPAPAPSPHDSPVEAVLASYGYVWWADVVRQRRKSAEHCVPGPMY
jgi:hypothetical protein